ncbi:MAG: hypothetical protein WBA97_06155 [Actinophytocola sp.]|uniref:hypothetical protein n=1 Tax=Actinophytocola sp. TaxID=1872138 RepID=UPI003C707788
MRTVLRLRTHEVPPALTGIDAPRTVVDELVWREVRNSGAGGGGARRIGRWRLDPGSDNGFALLWGTHSGHGMLLPAAGLRAVRAAALTVTAARLFLYSRVATVSVLGGGLAAHVVLAELAAHVPGISHVAVCAPDGCPSVPADLAADLELAGIGLAAAESAADAGFGANLVVLTCPPGEHDDWQPPRGALIVNASGQAPPASVVAQADQVFVDDRAHPSRAGRVTARLGQVLAGSHPGRRAPDDVVLVDLLGLHTGGVWLAYRLYEAARSKGLGVPVRTPESGGL